LLQFKISIKLSAIIEETHANVIIGCESHIDDSFISTEVFPPNFTTFCKDQKIGGVVFICLHNSLNIYEEPSLDIEAEYLNVYTVNSQSLLYG